MFTTDFSGGTAETTALYEAFALCSLSAAVAVASFGALDLDSAPESTTGATIPVASVVATVRPGKR